MPVLHLLPHGVTLLRQLLQGRVEGRADAVVPRIVYYNITQYNTT